MEATDFWSALISPLFRLLLGLGIGVFLANFLEALQWTRTLAKYLHPISSAAHLGTVSSAAFGLAFISSASSNALLAENYFAGKLSYRELILANLFNSLPAYFLHTPTIFFITYPVLGTASLIYVGLSLLAAFLRTTLTFVLARHILPDQYEQPNAKTIQRIPLKTALQKACVRFYNRLLPLFLYTIPTYVLIYFLKMYGIFEKINNFLASSWLTSFLSPEACGIIILHLMAELGSALGCAHALLVTNGITTQDVILALLVGNILATPIRALRHQLPGYTGFYGPTLGMRLLFYNQSLRALSMLLITLLYVACTKV